MKRLTALLVALLLAAAPLALAEQTFSPYDFIAGEAGGGTSLVYDFPDVRLYLPIEWKGLITVEQTDAGVSFYQTASLERYAGEGIGGGGFLFQLCACADESYQDLPAYADLGYSEGAGLHFYLLLPTDDPAYPDETAAAEYGLMAAQIETVVEKAAVGPSLQSYTDGLESTDAGMS